MALTSGLHCTIISTENTTSPRCIAIKSRSYQFGRHCSGDEGVGPVDEEADGEEEADVARVALPRRLVQVARGTVALVRQQL